MEELKFAIFIGIGIGVIIALFFGALDTETESITSSTPKKKIAPQKYWGKIGQVDQWGDFGLITFYEKIDDEGNRVATYTEEQYKRKFGDRQPDYQRDRTINMGE